MTGSVWQITGMAKQSFSMLQKILPESWFSELELKNSPVSAVPDAKACVLQALFHTRLNLLSLKKTMISAKNFMQVNVLPAAAVPISALQDVNFPCVPAQPEIS